MQTDPAMDLAKARDRRYNLEDELVKTEIKLNKAIKSISEGLDSSGGIQQAADELTRKAVEQKEQLRKADEEIALLETKVNE